jgi:peptidoglycan/xylan/chitin deacetylase (PgdA/CDA1 family)
MSALRRLSRAARHFVEQDRPVILMYHRVARLTYDPWQLAVWPERFAEQIEALTHSRRVVPLRWLATQLAQGHVAKKVAAVTFDDGYVDTLTRAKPVLERQGCPATVFLATGAIGKSSAFWWDDLSRIIFEPPLLPRDLEVKIVGRVHRWRTDGRRMGPADRGAEDGPTLSRQQLHDEIWQLLRQLEPEPRCELLIHLGAWAGVEIEAQSPHRALNAEEVGRLVEPGFLDIGAHTVSHAVLSSLDKENQHSEIERSRIACEELIGEPIHAFAYPFGEFDNTAVSLVRECGFACACTTVPGRVSMRSDPMLLPRIAVGNFAGDELARRL